MPDRSLLPCLDVSLGVSRVPTQSHRVHQHQEEQCGQRAQRRQHKPHVEAQVPHQARRRYRPGYVCTHGNIVMDNHVYPGEGDACQTHY